MSPYLIGLAVLSVIALGVERLRPARPRQGPLRRRLLLDLALLVFNAHYLGAAIALVSARLLDPLTARLTTRLPHDLAAHWPAWLQLAVVLVVFDLMQWAIHVALHRSSLLWRLHRLHHSVADGEMDWLVSFRFNPLEGALYKAVQYLPFAIAGFSSEVLLAHALIGTAMGHFNHMNLDVDLGRLRYVLNSPRMHLWHHAADGPARNFAIIFSAWDWIFGTAHLPDRPPARIGLPSSE